MINIIESGDIEKSLGLFFKETLSHYLDFINKNKNFNLNINNINYILYPYNLK